MNGDILDRFEFPYKVLSIQFIFSLVDRLPNIAAVFFDSEVPENMEAMSKLEDIDDDCDNNGIPFVKIEDVTKAKDEFGLDSLPAVLYWKNGEFIPENSLCLTLNSGVPSVFSGEVSDPKGLLEWLVNSKSGDNIELVTEEILEDMVDKFEYVVAYFQAYCREGDEVSTYNL